MMLDDRAVNVSSKSLTKTVTMRPTYMKDCFVLVGLYRAMHVCTHILNVTKSELSE